MDAGVSQHPHGRPHERAHRLAAAALLHQISVGLGGDDRLLKSAPPHLGLDAALADEPALSMAATLASGRDHHAQNHARTGAPRGLKTPLAALGNPASPPAASTFLPAVELAFAADRALPSRASDDKELAHAVSGLERRFAEALASEIGKPESVVDRLLAVAQRLVHALPASSVSAQQQDVSLFDHARITAAFAAALGVMHSEPGRVEAKFRLLGFSTGGIQKFIFRQQPAADDPTSEKGMAQRLRARSFFVSLVTLAAGRRMLDACGLPSCNLVLDAGGRGMLLLPDDEATLEAVRQAGRFIHDWLSRELGAAIRLDVGLSRSLDRSDFLDGRFAAAYRECTQATDRGRLTWLRELLTDANGWKDEGWVVPTNGLAVDTPVFLATIRELGRALPRARWLGIDANDRAPDASDDPQIDLLGYRLRLSGTRPEASRVMALGLVDGDGRPMPLDVPVLVVGNYVPIASDADAARSAATDEEPIVRGQTLTFNALAERATDESGRQVGLRMLGVLKADVDRLGYLMGYGLGGARGEPWRLSIGRLATISRLLDWFFKGVLTEQLRTHYPNVYTVFSGGDDLFLIGPWYDMARLAGKLHGWFDRAACGNPALTLSAGLVFAKPGTPVRELAAAADAALDRAKDAGRNRLSLFSAAVPWPEFIGPTGAWSLHEQLLRAAGEGSDREVGRSLMHRLLQYAEMARRSRGQTVALSDIKWRAQMAYDLQRNLPSEPSGGVDDLRSRLVALGPQDADVLRIAATLTLYRLRGESE